MTTRAHERGFTLLELAISLVLVALLLAVLVPTLSNARQTAHREQCADNQRRMGEAWHVFLGDHDLRFPYVPVQPGWLYAGMRFSSVDGSAFPDYQRPLNAYLPLTRTRDFEKVVCACPADRGITDPSTGVGTGDRTAFRSFGISYRANSSLLDAKSAPSLESDKGAAAHAHDANTIDQTVFERATSPTSPDEPAGVTSTGLARGNITVAPSRLVVMGDPVWYEMAEDTGRIADWHGKPGTGNLLFLDGSVRFLTVRSRRVAGPIVFEPTMPGAVAAPRAEDVRDDEQH